MRVLGFRIKSRTKSGSGSLFLENYLLSSLLTYWTVVIILSGMSSSSSSSSISPPSYSTIYFFSNTFTTTEVDSMCVSLGMNCRTKSTKCLTESLLIDKTVSCIMKLTNVKNFFSFPNS